MKNKSLKRSISIGLVLCMALSVVPLATISSSAAGISEAIVSETTENSSALSVDENGAYIVKSYEDLCQMLDMINSGNSEYADASYILVNDIDCTGKAWKPAIATEANEYTSTFDGQNHTIKNFAVDSDEEDGSVQGILSALGEMTVVKNLNVENA